MKKTRFFEQGKRWAEIEISLENGRLSICGSYGRIITQRQGHTEAFEYWRSFFEDQPKEIFDMNQRMGTRFSSASGAARYVLEQDGEFHGLDVHIHDGGKLYVDEGGGQCIDRIEKDFPDFPNIGRIKAIWERWHLNDMRAGCEHQEELLRNDSKLPRDYVELTKRKEFDRCPICRYSYGSAWKKEELPEAIVKELETL